MKRFLTVTMDIFIHYYTLVFRKKWNISFVFLSLIFIFHFGIIFDFPQLFSSLFFHPYASVFA